MSEGTVSVFPGWYVEFQAALLRQAPRPGKINQDTAEGWTNNQRALKGVLAEGLLPKPEPQLAPAPVEKFALLADLGIITVPNDYDHATWLAAFRAKYQDGGVKSFYHYNEFITDQNFVNPSRILNPGDELWVRAFKQIVPGRTTSKEWLTFIKGESGILTGAQGASLVWEQKHNQLPKGYWYCSFDKKDRLPLDAAGHHRVPGVSRLSDGDYKFGLGGFGDAWDADGCVLVFCDKPAVPAGK